VHSQQKDIATPESAAGRRALTTEVVAAMEQLLADEILFPLLRSASAANPDDTTIAVGCGDIEGPQGSGY
jgi:hypothetical protein